MIKAKVTYSGAHLLAMERFRKPVDILGLISLAMDLVWVTVIGKYAMLMLRYSKRVPDAKSTAVTLFLCCGLFAYLFINGIVKRIRRRKKLLSQPTEETVREFSFTDSSVSCEYTSRDESGSFNISYEGISAAAETKEHFVFSVDGRTSAYAVGKADITEGSAEELRGIFAERTGKNFRRRCK